MTEEVLDPDVVVESEDKPYTIQIRISGQQFKVMTRLADMLYKNKAIKTNSVNALARACTFTQINLYLNMEAKELAYQEKERQLELERIELEKKGVVRYQDVVPNFGKY